MSNTSSSRDTYDTEDLLNNRKDDNKSKDFRRSGEIVSTPKRSPLASKKYVAHRFADYRLQRGRLFRQMREKRGLTQNALGSSAIETGKALQVGTMELFARMRPCPREMCQFGAVTLAHIPIRCTKCRQVCKYRDTGSEQLHDVVVGDVSLDHLSDDGKEISFDAPAKIPDLQFREFRRARGRLIQSMREKRELAQRDIGTPSQVRLYESGEVSQISTMQVLFVLKPCPREGLKLWRIIWNHLPIACVDCKEYCKHKTVTATNLAISVFKDLTLDPVE